MHVLTSRSSRLPLAWAELPDRALRPDEVRVATRAVSVNPVDWKMREVSLLGFAQRILGPRGPFVCGVDFAGEVIEAGPKADLSVGDRVVGGTDFSRSQRGSYARTVQVRASQVAVLPPNVSFDAASCLPVAGVTAAMAVRDHGGTHRRPGSRVLVLGASGGVGHFAVQLARIDGAAVIAGVCSQRNTGLVQRLGATPIDYGAGDALDAARALGPFDVIVDAIGSTTYPVRRCKALLAKGGVLVQIMPMPRDYLHLAIPGPVKTVLGRPSRQNLAPLVAHLAAGTLDAVIAERLPLGEAERAHELSRAGRVVGKLVLTADA
ncbi:MAG: NAD(P)-dependent alcohol dehydrogenase [Myxococcales bacterium]|nr:NAD(P)-dependent alcohol dehydrogenase [Myxococcales bacterium]